MYIDPLLEPALPVLRVSLDTEQQSAHASLLGLYRQTALYRPGLGCSLVHDPSTFDASLALPDPDGFQPLSEDVAHRAAHFDEDALEAALDQAFAEPTGGGRNTLAVAILHQGRLVAQRYADGVDAETPLHGWSMSKSAITALAGAMAQRGEVELTQAGIPNNSAHAGVTLEHLLRMTSGLDLAERNDGADPNSDMLFTEGDMAAWAAQRDGLYPPGTRWQYMSGNTVLAARLLQDALGSTLSQQVNGLRDVLFNPLNMHSAILEVDEAGNFQGSSYLYASAHDWARLGQLFLQDGVWNGQQVLVDGWVEQVDTATEGSREEAYGMGFWRGHPSPEAPAGIYYMDGFQSQYTIIVPSHELVIVRLGATNGTGSGTFKMVLDVIDAMKAVDPSTPRGNFSSD